MLFNPDDIKLPAADATRKRKPRPQRPGNAAIRTASAGRERGKLIEAVRLGDLRELVPILERGDVLHLVASGSWSNYDLIEHLAGFTGPADLWVTSWGLSEHGVARLSRLKGEGVLTGVVGVVDTRTAIQHSGATAHLYGICRRFAACSIHAKIYVLRNASWGVSIVTSANLTQNPKIEAGVVTESSPIADFYIEQIEAFIAAAPPFKPNKRKGSKE